MNSEFPVTCENCWSNLFADYISWNETCSYRVVLARARSKVLSEIPLGARRRTYGGRSEHVWPRELSKMIWSRNWDSPFIQKVENTLQNIQCQNAVVHEENCKVYNDNTQLKPVSSLKRAGNYYQIRIRSLQFLLLLTADALSSCEHQSSPCYIWRSSYFPAISGFVLAFTVWLWKTNQNGEF